MFEADNIRDWRGKNVIDPNGDKIGSLEAVYVDTTTDLPSFASVQIGIVGRHKLVFAPLDGATVGPNYVRIHFAKKIVKSGPSIETDGELEATAEPDIFEHFGLDYSASGSGERRLARR